MFKIKYILFLAFLFCVNITFAQKNERDYIRSGNRYYKDSLFIKAEVDYRKAIEVNPRSTEALFNLGNALVQQEKFDEAMEQYELATKMETNKTKLSQMYHNIGVLLQSSQQYPQCIEAYKQALRNNPDDDETRYNLALAQRMQNEGGENDQNDENEDQNQDKDQQNQDQQQNEDQQQNQDQQQQQQQQPENEMSKENAEQLLNAAMQDEKQTQEKIREQQQQVQTKQLDKNW